MFDEWSTENAGATDDVDSYSCSVFIESGPEYAYEFVTDTAANDTVRLIPEAGLISTCSCSPGAETAACGADLCDQYNDNELTFTATPDVPDAVVVDGFRGDAGNYRIEFICE